MLHFLKNKYTHILLFITLFGAIWIYFWEYLHDFIYIYFVFFLWLLILLPKHRTTVALIFFNSLLLLPAFFISFLLHLQYFSTGLFILFIASFIWLFFWKKYHFLSFLPLALYVCIVWLFFYLDWVGKWWLCSYEYEWHVWSCECSWLTLGVWKVELCQWERRACFVSWSAIKWWAIPCENHILPENFPWK